MLRPCDCIATHYLRYVCRVGTKGKGGVGKVPTYLVKMRASRQFDISSSIRDDLGIMNTYACYLFQAEAASVAVSRTL